MSSVLRNRGIVFGTILFVTLLMMAGLGILPQGSTLEGVSAADASQATGGGGSWTPQNSGTTDTLRGVCVTSPSECYVVGDSGSILKTTDGGKTWTAQNSWTTKDLYAVSFADANNGWVVGEDGYILHTKDGGKNWKVVQDPLLLVPLKGVSATSPKSACAVGPGGWIINTDDLGETWTNQIVGTKNLKAVFTDDSIQAWWTVGDDGTVLNKTHEGEPWTFQVSGTTKDLNGVSAPSANHAFAVGDNGTIVVTDNGGLTWGPRTSNAPGDLAGVSSTSVGIDQIAAFAVGSNGTIVNTEDGGKTWTPQDSGTTKNLNGVSAVSGSAGQGGGSADTAAWAVGDGGTILKHTPASTWFLAEGSTAWGFSCYVTIENPNDTAVNCEITYMTTAGEVPGGTVTLPAKSQATVNPAETLGEQDFSTRVECAEGKLIAVDRTMSWPVLMGASAVGSGITGDGHCSIGVTAPAKTWYLPEGSSAWGFETWLLIQNPNATEANVTLTYMIEGAQPVVVDKTVTPNGRNTFNMEADIGQRDASIMVESDLNVIPERAMYKPAGVREMGHDSIGTTEPAIDYFLAEGTTAWGFTTYVLIQNPADTANEVNVTYLTGEGEVAHPENPIAMEPNSRKTIKVNDYLAEKDFSTQVTGTSPIIAERAMYWGEGKEQGEACHDSIGMASPHTTFYLPDGQTSDGYETYTLVMNPNDTPVDVEITYMTLTGADNVTFTDTVGANSRTTYDMISEGINGRAAVLVECKTAGSRIMVERAMYWNSRSAGTDTIGGYSD